MRVICTMNDNDVEGEVIGGRVFDAEKNSYDLNEMFTVRCDDGEVIQVYGWLVDVTVLNSGCSDKM